jgi:Amidohydrolase family
MDYSDFVVGAGSSLHCCLLSLAGGPLDRIKSGSVKSGPSHRRAASLTFVTPVAARLQLWASLARETLKGTYGAHPFGLAEAVDIYTALRSYTAWGARQMFLENQIGTLEVGKKADIAIWFATSTR